MAVIETSTPVHVDDEWRRWIAENLLLDSRPQDVYDELLRAGISSEETTSELCSVSCDSLEQGDGEGVSRL